MLKEIFGSPKPKKPAVVVKPAAPAAPSTPAAPPVSQTVLGAGTHFEGTLRAESHVRVDGTFLGNISTKGRILVGEQGKVDGDLVGEAVDVAGMVRGDITARRISVARTGRVVGDLRLEKLTTEEGGFIQGLVRMEEKVSVAEYLPATPQQVEEPQAEAEAEPLQEEAQAELVPVTPSSGGRQKVAGKGGK